MRTTPLSYGVRLSALAGALVALTSPNTARACDYNADGSPVVTSQWILQGNRDGMFGRSDLQDPIADDNQIVWIGGAYLGSLGISTGWLQPDNLVGTLNGDLAWYDATAAANAATAQGSPTPWLSGWRMSAYLGNVTDWYTSTHIQIFSVDKSCLVGGPVNVAPFRAVPEREAFAHAESSFWNGCTYSENRTDAGPGTAAAMLSGFTMAGWGFGEWVQVDQGSTDADESTIVAHDENCDGYLVAGHATWFEVAGGVKPPLFVGPGYGVLELPCETCDSPPSPTAGPLPTPHLGAYGDVGTWQVSSDGNNFGGFHSLRMAKAKDAMCYLVGLSGKFIGSGEYMYMDIEDGGDGAYWMLNVNAVDGSVFAMANCFAYYQQAPTSIHPSDPPPVSGRHF